MSAKEAIMECPKCKGMVVREWVPEAIEEEYHLRCLNCGWVAPIEGEKERRSPGIDEVVAECCCDHRKNAPTDAP
jgi:uncharacterized Zn finger protein